MKTLNYVNNLKLLATILVFICHCSIVCNEVYGFKLIKSWQFLLKTPAGGGVWIFLILSGFLASNGFKTGYYKLDKNGIKNYYLKRIKKILIPCWVFISMIYLLCQPAAQLEPLEIIRYLTCTFNGSGSNLSYVGASWYVFSVMWLYFFTPFFYSLINKVEEKNKGNERHALIILLISIILFGLLYRISGRYFGLSWNEWIYSSLPGCFDLFFSGMIINELKQYSKISSSSCLKLRKISIFFFCMLIILSSYLFHGEERGEYMYVHIYKYITPSFYLIIVNAILFSYGNSMPINENNSKIKKIIALIVPYTFMFYLWHSQILSSVAKMIDISEPFNRYLLTMVIGGFVTCYIAYLMTKMNRAFIKNI